MRAALRRWNLGEAAPLPGFSPIVGRILAARGMDHEAAAALVSTRRTLHDPFTLCGMPEAVIAIGVAVSQGDRIAIYGDYDADGVTACAMLTVALRAAGADVVPYIPNRMTEGYGLHAPALDDLASRGVRCVVTVDCGTSSADVAAARPAGLRLVITDHHLPLAPGGGVPLLPDVDALVNPKQPACDYAFDALAGAGVAWKLVCALEAEHIVPPGSADNTIALAALGTVADMMPLRGENRDIVALGLSAMNAAPWPGLRALLDVAGVRNATRASDLAFGVAPRINAAGRMEDAELALRLCLAADIDEARPIAERLQLQNGDRQQLVVRALAEAEARVAGLPEDAPAIVVGDPGWPMGIVGLVAGRLAERYARPTFVVCLDGDEAKGSARSVRGVHVVQALDRASDTLIRYGGHAAAAGFSLHAARFDDFARAISDAVADQLHDTARERVFHIDAVVRVADLTPQLCTELAVLEPCGQGNPEPLLALLGCRVLSASTFGADRRHVRVALTDDSGSVIEGVAFNKPGLAGHLPRGRVIDVCFGVDLDTWDGMERVRLRLRDMRPARDPATTQTGVATAAAAAVAV
jgi:single-stranded-DNA-specific exonuclease